METTETKLAILNPNDFGIAKEKAITIESAFAPKMMERDGYLEVYNQLLTKEISTQLSQEASTLRKKLVKVRTGIADIHKTEKAYYLAAGKFCDALKNKLTLPIEQMEEKLTEIEKFYEIQEQKRKEQLQKERTDLLTPYNVENIHALALGEMSDDVWNMFFGGVKTKFEADKLAAEKAEQERIEQEKAEAAERERIRIENERLKQEAAEKEKELEIERQRVAKEKAEDEKKIKAEREENERLQAQIKAKAEKEEREKREAEKKIADELKEKKAAEAKAAKAPKKQKLTIWVDGFTIAPPTGMDADETVSEILTKFEAFKKWSKSQIELL